MVQLKRVVHAVQGFGTRVDRGKYLLVSEVVPRDRFDADSRLDLEAVYV